MDVIDAFYLLHDTLEKDVTEKMNMTKPMKPKLVAGKGKMCYVSISDKPTILLEGYFF
jgi:hypothetical protein